MNVMYFEMNHLGYKLISSVLQFLHLILDFPSVPVYKPNEKTYFITLLSHLIYKMQKQYALVIEIINGDSYLIYCLVLGSACFEIGAYVYLPSHLITEPISFKWRMQGLQQLLPLHLLEFSTKPFLPPITKKFSRRLWEESACILTIDTLANCLLGGMRFKRCAFIPLSIRLSSRTNTDVWVAVGRCSLVQVKDFVKHAVICPLC